MPLMTNEESKRRYGTEVFGSEFMDAKLQIERVQGKLIAQDWFLAMPEIYHWRAYLAIAVTLRRWTRHTKKPLMGGALPWDFIQLFHEYWQERVPGLYPPVYCDHEQGTASPREGDQAGPGTNHR